MPHNYNPPDEPAGPSETVLKFPADVELRAGDCAGGAMTDKPKTPFEISTDELAQGQTPAAVLATSISFETNQSSPAVKNIISLLQSQHRRGTGGERAVKRTVRGFIKFLLKRGREGEYSNAA
jgi:hypothetical protein